MEKMTSTRTHYRPENIIVQPIVVPELELDNIQCKIFFADFMIAPHHATFEQRPEAFNRLRMNRADNVLASRMVNGSMEKSLVQPVVTAPLVGAKQADLSRDGFAYKIGKC